MLTWTRQQVTTLLTVVIVVLWIITALVRFWVDFPAAAVLDSAMPLIIGYYFISKKDNGEATT